MKKITFANSKGGVGKTTLTVGVARTLAELGKRVLLLDIDPQGNLSSVFLNKDFLTKDFLSYWFNSEITENQLKTTIEKSNYKNIDIVPCYTKLMTQTIKSLTNDVASDFVLKNNIKKIEKHLNTNYDYVFFDINPTTTIITTNVFLSVDEIIVTVSPHKFSFNGIERFFSDYNWYLDKWKKIGLTMNNNMNAIVLNNVRKNKTHAVLVEKLENSNLRNIILKTKIPSSITLEKHTMLSSPTITDKSPFWLLTKELIQKNIF
ncbi:ParA family protein [Spiroplasma ixodetis]|uniref:AAA family ATPase n=1 Tax=Spiroplasma ixodetis TaxID=2141 RepID=A0ABM8JQP5_9MOLU